MRVSGAVPAIRNFAGARLVSVKAEREMRAVIFFASLLTSLICLEASAGEPNFDGIWVGKETVMMVEHHGPRQSEPYPANTPARIAIAHGGSMLAVVDGYGAGRYEEVRRAGNTLVFRAGSRIGQLSLSADGNTLTEKGIAPRTGQLHSGQREGVATGHRPTIELGGVMQVTGTFQRVAR